MQIDHLKKFYEGLKTEGIIFSFSGPLSQVILESIGETVRKKMTMDATGFATIQRVFSILVEQAQNILNYSVEITPARAPGEDLIRSGVLALGIDAGHYFVCCGNYIPLEKIEPLSRELSMLRDLDPEGIRQLYRKRRKAPPPKDSLGAGLGLIEIARRSTRPIAFDVRPADDHTAFFAFKAVI